MIPSNRGLFNIAYETKQDRWVFDLTLLYEGHKNIGLPNSEQINNSQISNGESTDFITLNTQVTRIIKNWQIYIGAENLTDFRQEQVVVGADDPFGPDFDATNVWGPIVGRKIYLGFRFNLNSNWCLC